MDMSKFHAELDGFAKEINDAVALGRLVEYQANGTAPYQRIVAAARDHIGLRFTFLNGTVATVPHQASTQCTYVITWNRPLTVDEQVEMIPPAHGLLRAIVRHHAAGMTYAQMGRLIGADANRVARWHMDAMRMIDTAMARVQVAKHGPVRE